MRQASELWRRFVGHLGYLEATRGKMGRLLSTGALVDRDVDQVYAGLYLESVTSFESLLEELFIGLLCGYIETSSPRAIPRISVRSSAIAREVVFGGRQYADWLPYQETERRAKRFFRGGLPFTSLNDKEKASIAQLSYVRNAIVHKRRHSMRMFKQEVVGTNNLLPRERKPVGYLRSVFRFAPVQTRYEYFVAEMATTARKLCS